MNEFAGSRRAGRSQGIVNHPGRVGREEPQAEAAATASALLAARHQAELTPTQPRRACDELARRVSLFPLGFDLCLRERAAGREHAGASWGCVIGLGRIGFSKERKTTVIISAEDLKLILAEHRKWLYSECGKRAVLTGAVGATAPVIPNIDSAILAAVESPGCETTHCRAGWAVTLAGLPGKMLEERIGPSATGALIYAASRPGKPIPNFFATTEEAMEDMRKCAAESAN